MAIDNIYHVSTKQGDKGSSKNYSNESLPKHDILFETLGTIDELSSVLGITFHHTHYEQIKVIQRTLESINSLVATNPQSDAEKYASLRKITDDDIDFVESEEKKILAIKALEPKFHLPGSDTTPAGSYFDYSRTITRRAERMLVRFIANNERDDLDVPARYLNRLSDLMFLLARNYQS